MPETSGVENVVRSAWERRLLVVTVERTAIAVAVVLGALVVMLLLGTQVLDWRWLLSLGAVGAGIVVHQVRQRLLGHYRVAQLLDHRLHLADSLSTAWYLLTRPGAGRSPITEYQLKGAESVAQRVDLAAAFPFTGQRLWAIAAGLALLAGSLLGVRYFVTNSLSLRPSLIPLQMADVFERGGAESEEAKREKQQAAGADAPRSQKNTPKADGQKDEKEPPRAEPPPLAQGNTPGAGQNPNDPGEMRAAKESQDEQNKEKSEAASGNAAQKAGDKQGEDGEKTAGAQKSSSEDEANNPKSSNSMLDRMKEALSSLAAKMRPNQGKQGSDQQQQGDDKKGDQQQSGSKEENTSAQQNAASREASEQQQASEGQGKGKTQEKTKAGQGKSADQTADKSKSDSHSGIGSQDGDKSMKDSDQLKAMGKLAEIIGQRSAKATGDVMVENPSGKQKLQTEYSQRLGHHEDLGGEINRDEIPLMYQQYVREYMSEVRQLAKRHKPRAPHASATNTQGQ